MPSYLLFTASAGRRLVYASIVALACACSDSVPPADIVPSTLNEELRGKVVLVPSINSAVWASDPLTLSDVAIDGDTLRVRVTYGGGCRRHALQPIAETVWLESYPVQVHARVAHNAGADPCDALITRSLHVDLSPLKELYRQSYQSSSGRIKVRLAGAKDVPVYEF